MNLLEEYILEKEGEQRDLLMYFHHLLTDEFGLIPKLRYRIPFYYGTKWICYTNATKKGVEFSFIKGNLLKKLPERFESRGRKMVVSTHYQKLIEVDETELKAVIKQAIAIDKRKSKA